MNARSAAKRNARAGQYERSALSVFAQEGRPDSDRVNIQIWYNGGFPRTHSGITIGFLRHLEAYLDRHPKLDIEWRLT